MIEWTLTNHISLADARRYTGSMQLTNAEEKVKELKIIDTLTKVLDKLIIMVKYTYNEKGNVMKR